MQDIEVKISDQFPETVNKFNVYYIPAKSLATADAEGDEQDENDETLTFNVREDDSDLSVSDLSDEINQITALNESMMDTAESVPVDLDVSFVAPENNMVTYKDKIQFKGKTKNAVELFINSRKII